MKNVLTCLLLGISMLHLHAQKDYIDINDLNPLNNTSWKGQLTYRDYQSGKWVPVDATMQIAIKGDKITTAIQYSYEPEKNNRSTVKLKDDGRFYGNERVLSNVLSEGFRIIKTTYSGRDDNRKAQMFITYKFNDESYSVVKEVRYEDSQDLLIRNQYHFNKN